ncbi:PaaI family thioesterase [Aquabacterium sp.]|uniref:PaaI family thioesterase n=1 Tax=Aquabacterium sp. TaxID=1872578 RepID=UPI002CFE141E|nr:PaaI family thioesterase [Aquabacterium sp.]HSW04513.1 PaaI family thioesterase [Aquabacterium sp.]
MLEPVAFDDPRQLFDRVPFMRLLGVQRIFSEGGRARLVLAPRAELGNVIGGVHGGAVVTLLDVVMASAAVSAIDFRRTAVTLNLDTAFVEPGRGTLTADGELLREADGIAWCSATVTDDDGRIVARAQGSFRYLPLPRTSSGHRPTSPEGDTP